MVPGVPPRPARDPADLGQAGRRAVEVADQQAALDPVQRGGVAHLRHRGGELAGPGERLRGPLVALVQPAEVAQHPRAEVVLHGDEARPRLPGVQGRRPALVDEGQGLDRAAEHAERQHPEQVAMVDGERVGQLRRVEQGAIGELPPFHGAALVHAQGGEEHLSHARAGSGRTW